MPNRPQVQVQGAKELRRTMKAAGEDLGDLKAVHERVGRLVVGVAGGLAPVVSGRLASSLRPSRMVGGVAIKAGSAGVPYAGPIHWGWPARNIEAQPFLTEGAQNSEPQWVALYEAELERIIQRIEGDKT